MANSGIPESPDMMVRFMRSGEIFTPSVPIDNQALFAGRVNQLNRIRSAIDDDGSGSNAVYCFSCAGIAKLRSFIGFVCFSVSNPRKYIMLVIKVITITLTVKP